nr:MAG TPA: hypothetical protein [Caudoviricetes sp.]
MQQRFDYGPARPQLEQCCRECELEHLCRLYSIQYWKIDIKPCALPTPLTVETPLYPQLFVW